MTKKVSRYVATASLTFLLAMSLIACSKSRTDPQIIGDVVTKINADSRLPNKQLAISSSGGVVTLSGTVASDDERAAAAGDTAQIEGVKTVVNNLAVTPPVVAEATPAPEPPQPEKPRPVARKKPTADIQHSTPVSNTVNTSGPIAPSQTAANVVPVAPPPPPPPPPPQPVTIPGGTTFVVRMVDGIDTARAQAGDTFRATLDAPITMDDKTVVPKGAEIVGRVAEAKGAGHFAGKPQLALELSSFSMNGREYSLHTNQYTQQGESRTTRTAETVGGGAALGAIIGAIAGGGRGAAIGATVGAAGGGGVQAATKAKQIVIAPEAQLSFRLESPLTVTPGTSSGRGNRGDRFARDNRQNNPTDYSDNTSDLDQPVLRRRPSGNNNDDNN